ncbi:MAG TPA: hypothetical protein VLD19_20015, partial [Chitinophagaceae bacterium]|nr:hypothetical protein [Chitinophagaceae bacterium]
KPLRMSTVVEDKRLAQLFRYKVLSHEAWIYKGKLVALTQADYVDSAGISFILSGKKNNWPVKDDFVADADTAKTFLQINPAQLPDKNIPLRYAAVFGYRPGGYSIRGVAYDRLRHTRRVYFTNDIILSAYFHYWHELRDPDFKKGLAYTPDSNRIIMEVKSRYPYAFPDELHEHNDEYHRTHMICYESVAPDDGASRGALARAVIADLDHLLGLHGRFETRKTKCLVLVRTSTEDKLKAPANVTQTTGRESVGAWHNRSLKDLAETINKRSMPVLDETGYTGNVYMDLNISSWTDIPALRKALHAYDLDLKEEERDLELFILTETKQ